MNKSWHREVILCTTETEFCVCNSSKIGDIYEMLAAIMRYTYTCICVSVIGAT